MRRCRRLGWWRSPLLCRLPRHYRILSGTSFVERTMEAIRSRGGIQQLLAAVQEAQHIVNAARNAKMVRLKQAKEEAEKEVAEYQSQMEAAFQGKVATVSTISLLGKKLLFVSNRTQEDQPAYGKKRIVVSTSLIYKWR